MSEKWSWFGLQLWQVTPSKQFSVWLAGYCWVCGGAEEGRAFSQDVASLPLLRGAQEESSTPFNFFLNLCCVCKGHIPCAGLWLVLFFLCCLPYSQLEGQENLIWKTTSCMSSVITGRQHPPVPGTGSLMPRSSGPGQAWIIPSHGDDTAQPSLLKASLVLSCKELYVTMQPCWRSSCGETGKEAPPGHLRWQETSPTFNFLLFSV